MKITVLPLLSALVFSFLAVATPVQAYDIPPSTGYVNDFADLLEPEAEELLETQLTATAEKSNADVRVVTLQSLQGETTQAVSDQFFSSWEIGQKEQPIGVLLLVSVQDQALEIATNQNDKPIVPENVKETVIKQKIAPSFNETNYQTGIQAGINSILLYLDNPESIFIIELSANTAPAFNIIFARFALLMAIYLVVISSIVGVSYSLSQLFKNHKLWLGTLVALLLGFALGQIHQVGILTALVFGSLGFGLEYMIRKTSNN